MRTRDIELGHIHLEDTVEGVTRGNSPNISKERALGGSMGGAPGLESGISEFKLASDTYCCVTLGKSLSHL